MVGKGKPPWLFLVETGFPVGSMLKFAIEPMCFVQFGFQLPKPSNASRFRFRILIQYTQSGSKCCNQYVSCTNVNHLDQLVISNIFAA